MPIQDTGLDVYESAMRPVRQNVQAIFAHQAKQKADAEAERRQMELEQRTEQTVIRTEGRRKTEEDADAMAAAVAAAGRYGLPTENRTPEQLQQDVEKEVAKKEPRDFLMANMDKLPGILDQEKISAIQNNALSEGELAQIKANVEGRIQVSRADDAEMFRKKSPVYLEELVNQQKVLTRIATQISEIKGQPLGQLARRAIERAFPKDGSQGADDWLKFQQKAAMRTIQDPEIQDILDNPKYPLLRRNFANNPGAFSLNSVPIDADGNMGDSMTDGDRMLLMEAYARAQDKIIEITGDDEERKYWRRESLLKAAHEARIPEAKQMEFLRQRQHAVWGKYPELADWNSQQQKVMPKVKETTTDSSSASSGFGNPMERLERLAAGDTDAPAVESVAPPAIAVNQDEQFEGEVVGREVVGQNPDGTNIVATTSRGPVVTTSQGPTPTDLAWQAAARSTQDAVAPPVTGFPPINAAASALGPGVAPKSKPYNWWVGDQSRSQFKMFSPEWEAEYKRDRDNRYYRKKLNETNATIADMERRSPTPSSSFAWYNKAVKEKAMFEGLISATEPEPIQPQPYQMFQRPPAPTPAPAPPAPAGQGSLVPETTDYGQEIEKIKKAMGPSVQGQLGQKP